MIDYACFLKWIVVVQPMVTWGSPTLGNLHPAPNDDPLGTCELRGRTRTTTCFDPGPGYPDYQNSWVTMDLHSPKKYGNSM